MLNGVTTGTNVLLNKFINDSQPPQRGLKIKSPDDESCSEIFLSKKLFNIICSKKTYNYGY